MITPSCNLKKLCQIPITVGQDKKLGKHKIIKNTFAKNEDLTSDKQIAKIIGIGKIKISLEILIINVLPRAVKNWSERVVKISIKCWNVNWPVVKIANGP